ncbi:mitochondrial nicotinamide adenine dinucleotide transporter SLC25A51 [Anabrus simplex]|uniref:mitochondrial nicotinamide adenine dinucleotide transporter SLC25A51 n=1 Tax=Anabrus simplex TaxID=316456 RepID=UPI0035A3767C
MNTHPAEGEGKGSLEKTPNVDTSDLKSVKKSFFENSLWDLDHKLSRNDYLQHEKEFICGWGAAFINITVTYPIYKLIFRQMLHGVGVTSAFQQLSNEGLFYLYRGILPPLCQKTGSLSIMFGVYEQCKTPLVEQGMAPVLAKTIAGLVSGSAEAILMPFERIQTLLQDANYHNHFRNSSHIVKVIGLNYGIKEYYRGLTPILLRNGPSNVMFFLMKDEVKLKMPENESWYGEASHNFLSGAFIGSFISTVFYPLNVIKVHMQSKLGGPFEGLWTVVYQICSERGLRNMYRGVHLNYTRAFISWGVINVSYEYLRKLLA